MASNSPDQVHPADDRAPPPATHDTAGYPPRDNSQPRDQPRRAPMDAPEGPPFKLWVGGFRLETQQEQVREAFGRFGAITHCWIARNPPGFGYIEYDTAAEAQAAIDGMNGELFDGEPLKVEFSRNRGPRKPRRDFGDRGGFRGGDRGGHRGGYGGGDRGGYRGGGDRAGGYDRGSRDAYSGGGGYGQAAAPAPNQ